MKKLNVLIFGLIVTLGLSSCIKEDSYDENAQFEMEKPLLEQYAKEHFTKPMLNQTLGIWYDVLKEGDPDSYEYKLIEDDQNLDNRHIEAPEVTVKYSLHLLDGTTIEDQSTGVKISLGGTIYAWQFAFLPEGIDSRGGISGLTENGLKKGSQIRFVTPSRWAYRNSTVGNIPKNSPLVFEIEVLDIHSPEDTAE